MAADGSASFEPLVAAGGDIQAGDATFLAWTATGAGAARQGTGTFSLWTATGTGFSDAAGLRPFSALTATGTGHGNGVGAPSFSAWTAAGHAAGRGDAAFEEWTSAGLAVEAGRGNPSFEPWTSTGEAHDHLFGTGAASFESLSAVGGRRPRGEASFEPWTSTGLGRGRNAGAATLEALQTRSNAAFVSLQPLTGYGAGAVVLSSVYAVKVMNTRTSAVSEYTNYAFNSFAKIGGSWYGAGSDGLIRLDGTNDDGDNINWIIRTGQHDDGNSGLKRLPELLLALRASGKVRVRVHSDDNTYHDYTFPAVQTGTIHQHRVVVGKGLRSRYFMVELQGMNGTDLELDSMIIELTKTTRRLG